MLGVSSCSSSRSFLVMPTEPGFVRLNEARILKAQFSGAQKQKMG